MFDQLHGKEISYNNLLDIAAAVELIAEFADEPTFAILKHNNACGVASRDTILQAYLDALACDPVSAFGGVLIANRPVEADTAAEIDKLFCEVVIAPSYSAEALEILKHKKNRIVLVQKDFCLPEKQVRSCLGGILVQDRNTRTDAAGDMKVVTDTAPTEDQVRDMIFASKICKHSKSNAIVLAKDRQLYASGIGQTSRIDALRQAVEKAESFEFDLRGAVLASDAYFPFADGVELADKAGIRAVVQPGGSIRDQLSIDYCNEHGLSMVFTGTRHFKH